MPQLLRVARYTAVAVVASFIAAAGAIAASGFGDRIIDADMVVVPGNTVYSDGTLSNRLKGRLDAALTIYRAGRCQAIFVSGAVGAEGIDEAIAMRTYLVQQGVAPNSIIEDHAGFDTEATASNAAAELRRRHLTKVLAVTQYFHISRLRLLLQRHGVHVVGSAHANYFELRDLYSLAREVVAVAVLHIRSSAS
jgi:vancomycin permeability regulator SanA